MATGASFRVKNPSINLLSILKTLKRGISEEEAWAIAYQAVVTAEECFEKGTLFNAVEKPSQLWLNSDGEVGAKSFNAILCDNPDVDGKLRPFLNVPVVPLGGNENATLNATKPFLYVKIICEGNQMRKYPGLQTLMTINTISSTAGKFYRDQCAHLAVEAIQKILDEFANVSSGFPTTTIIQLPTKELTTATSATTRILSVEDVFYIHEE